MRGVYLALLIHSELWKFAFRHYCVTVGFVSYSTIMAEWTKRQFHYNLFKYLILQSFLLYKQYGFRYFRSTDNGYWLGNIRLIALDKNGEAQSLTYRFSSQVERL